MNDKGTCYRMCSPFQQGRL